MDTLYMLQSILRIFVWKHFFIFSGDTRLGVSRQTEDINIHTLFPVTVNKHSSRCKNSYRKANSQRKSLREAEILAWGYFMALGLQG